MTSKIGLNCWMMVTALKFEHIYTAPGCLPNLETATQLQPDISQATPAVLRLQKTVIMLETD